MGKRPMLLGRLQQLAAHAFEVDVEPGAVIPRVGVVSFAPGGSSYTYNRLDWQGTPTDEDIEIQHGQKVLVLIL